MRHLGYRDFSCCSETESRPTVTLQCTSGVCTGTRHDHQRSIGASFRHFQPSGEGGTFARGNYTMMSDILHA